MGKRGPVPAPTSLKLVKGTQPCRINDAEPQPAADVVAAPKWLTGEGLKIWRQYAPDLERQGVLKPWDCEAFGQWCDLAAKRRRASAEWDKEGAVISEPVCDKEGNVVGHKLRRNPWTLVEKSCTDSMGRLGARFGLTPSDRSQLKVGDAKDHSPKGRLLTS